MVYYIVRCIISKINLSLSEWIKISKDSDVKTVCTDLTFHITAIKGNHMINLDDYFSDFSPEEYIEQNG